MSESDQWIKHFKEMEQERSNAKNIKDLIVWANLTSRKLEIARVRERKNGQSQRHPI